MAKNDFQYGTWNSYTLQCGMALESWQWIHQVASPCNMIRGSGMTCHWIRPNVRHIGILHLVSISTTSPQSTCHSATVSDVLFKSGHPRQIKITSWPFSRWRRISAIEDFQGPIMGSLKNPWYTTSYKSSIETIALNCLVFEKITFFLHFGNRQTDKQTDRQTNRWTPPMHWAALAVASGGLIKQKLLCHDR